ncbi:MAG: ComEC/Rec2 family competence protein, partial [Culicoidibacterales bacterium]
MQNFHLFNRQQFYARQKQVVGELQVKTVLGTQITQARYRQQIELLRWLEQRIPDPVVQTLVKTMILGETSDFDEDVRAVWQTLNISHILAISGLHAAVFIGIMHWCLCYLRITKQFHPWIIGGVLVILRWYNFASVSFTRIVCMWFVSLLLGERFTHYHKLLIALVVIASLWPYELLGVGIYYSFTCAFLLTLGHKLWQSKWSVVTLPLTLQLWLLPITFWQSGQFLPISLIANMIAIPFISCLVPDLLLVLIFPGLSPIIAGFYQAGVTVFDWLLTISPFALQLGQLSLLACMIISLLTYLSYRFQERRKFGRLLLCSCLLVGVFTLASRAQPEVAMLDIGQGDALVVIDERKKAFIIDTGGPMKLEKRHLAQETVVESYLRRKG